MLPKQDTGSFESTSENDSWSMLPIVGLSCMGSPWGAGPFFRVACDPKGIGDLIARHVVAFEPPTSTWIREDHRTRKVVALLSDYRAVRPAQSSALFFEFAKPLLEVVLFEQVLPGVSRRVSLGEKIYSIPNDFVLDFGK